MKKKGMALLRSVVAGLIFVHGLIFLPAAAIAKTAKPDFQIGASYRSIYSADVSQILSVLESRMEDRRLLERTKDKLLTLDDGQIRLIASLSHRVMREEGTTGSEIAFLLMTALITLI